MAGSADYVLVQRLRSGDDRAFSDTVRAWSPMMLRVARMHVSTDASAEEVVQEAWLAVVRGLADFAGRSSLRTWVFRIVTNRAKARGVREARFIPLPSIGAAGQSEPSPERSALTGEIRGHVTRALSLLPDGQRAVVTLRDVTGLTPDEVCHALDISSANQRVLLHRGRAALRAALQDFYSSDGAA